MLNLTKNNIDEEIKETIIVDFWAEWCSPCKEMDPIFDQLGEEIKNLKFAKLNVDKEPELAVRFGVMSIPTFLIIKKGEEIGRIVGSMQKSTFKEKIEESRKRIE
ncbi:MAG: thioredoxin [Candidatus Nanoarchaeia archaeon]|jgi:thioredoxin 1|nr:thioredoxin [Candidatus Nanoarchaeia archaeon]|tara:strand:- start:30250 stop:30564 length:315 start_codon:yes stop_codon:yes gene_type:complete